MNLWSNGCILCTVMVLLSLLWFCQVIPALLCIKEPFEILSYFHISVVIACKQSASLPFFSVKWQVYASEDFHCKAFYFTFFTCNSILKCEMWNRTKYKGISHKDVGLFPLVTPYLCSHRLQQLCLPQHWVRGQNQAASSFWITNPCHQKYCCLLFS